MRGALWEQITTDRVILGIPPLKLLHVRVKFLTGAEDSYVLVLNVESWTHFDGWFSDAGNFEVWMRASDLRTGQFNQAWCMIRTDHQRSRYPITTNPMHESEVQKRWQKPLSRNTVQRSESPQPAKTQTSG
ncbi:hypothetical protein A6F49_00495 [Enteractinococcus helveticum]|uniref:Uncharacterized protein n=1 Tax=Enteractinococcus helveticum TaxID=1837282 RepID=A0A1B7LVQ4_9MICC|nr:DUF1963 domain-containing protein [Enteractinococcus helveticum]OAV53972.1 hypothetical protein A6F49_00495 [Enteractinococcus helveticum]